MGRGTPHTKSTSERGYGTEYRRQREQWKIRVGTGSQTCWRCGCWINPALPWHLGHDDHDRRIIRGPEHPRCNLGAAARATNAKRRAKALQPVRSRAW